MRDGAVCANIFYIHIPLLFWLVFLAENKYQLSADSLENKQMYRGGQSVSTDGRSVNPLLG